MVETGQYYLPDLASVHDADFSMLALHAAAMVLALDSSGISSHRVAVDLGCGSGIFSGELAKAGYNVIGIDYSEAMVELARRRVPDGVFIQNSLFDFEIPRCSLVGSIGECFCYLFDGKSNFEALERVFRSIYHSLLTGGIFLFDILTNNVPAIPQHRFIENERWSMVLDISVDPDRQVLTRDITLFVKEGDRYRHTKETHRQQLYNTNDIDQLLTRIGFQVQILDNYNSVPFRQGHVGFLC